MRSGRSDVADFLWGVATGAHQTEGNNVASDWWEFEHAAGTVIPEPSGDAVDAYHRWQQDMDLAAKAGFTDFGSASSGRASSPPRAASPAPRWTITAEWSTARCGVGCGRSSRCTTSRCPRGSAGRGGWLRPDARDRFLRYVDAVGPVLAEGVTHVGTINEPNIVAMFATDSHNGMAALHSGLPVPDARVTDTLIDVHRASPRRVEGGAPETGCRVGCFGAGLPGRTRRRRRARRPTRGRAMTCSSRPPAATTGSACRPTPGSSSAAATVSPSKFPDLTAPRAMNGWEIYPEALGGALRRTAGIVDGTPIIVTENGIATADDEQRIEYTRGALASMDDAIHDGVDVRGYLHWSLVDNYEWGSYAPTFGLVAVDRETFVRTPRSRRCTGWVVSRDLSESVAAGRAGSSRPSPTSSTADQ